MSGQLTLLGAGALALLEAAAAAAKALSPRYCSAKGLLGALAALGGGLTSLWRARCPRPPPRVSRLFLHPVKGASPVEVRSVRLDELGFANDRRWAVVDMARPPATRVLHLAVEPRLALIRPELDDHLSPAARLELRAPGMQDLRVPSPSAEADRIEVGLWDTPGVALDCGQQAAEWLGHLLGRGGLRLAHLSVGPGGAGARPREPCREPHWNGGAEANSVYYPGSRVGFADSTLGTLLSASSIDDLNRRAPKGAKLLAPQNFRMNVIVSGTRPNEEEMWKGFCIGTVSGFVTSKLCSRCTATNVDPETGTKLPSVGQPLRLLSRYRGLGQVWRMDGRHRGPAFGVNFGGSAKSGVINVGDLVTHVVLRGIGDRMY